MLRFMWRQLCTRTTLCTAQSCVAHVQSLRVLLTGFPAFICMQISGALQKSTAKQMYLCTIATSFSRTRNNKLMLCQGSPSMPSRSGSKHDAIMDDCVGFNVVLTAAVLKLCVVSSQGLRC